MKMRGLLAGLGLSWRRKGGQNKSIRANTKIIGIIGLGRGVGVTHLAVMLGIYLAKGRNYKVAIVEYGQHGDFEQIRHYEKCRQARLSTEATKRHAFSSHGIDFYESIVINGFLGMMSAEYDYIIVDMRVEDSDYVSWEILGQWLKTDIRIAVVSFVPWKLRECTKRLDRIFAMAAGKSIQLVSLTVSKRKIKKEYLKSVKIIPWVPDPFQIMAKSLPWLKRLTENI